MTTADVKIQPLKLLAGRLADNLAALATREPDLAAALRAHRPSRQFMLLLHPDSVCLGKASPTGVIPLPNSVTPAAATSTVRQLYPTGFCDRPSLVMGEDLGWLWNALYQLPCKTLMLPGHRPPLYFLIGDLEQLWLMLHLQDWTQLLADPRVILFAGRDCVERFRGGMVTQHMLPWPQLSVVIDTTLWPAELTLTAVRDEAQTAVADRSATLLHMQQLTAINVDRFDPNRPMRVLGICSRYTTFLQHSMRDWLAGFKTLGHHTHLVIESHDHELPNALTVAEACLDFQPDLVVAIDHFRNEIRGIPEHTPCAMWVQDYLPSIFDRRGGQAQGDLDYTVGFAGLKLIHEFGYPAERFIPAMVGVDDRRFSNEPVDEADLDELRCEASFVSHASKAAETLLQDELNRLSSPAASRLLGGVFEQLRAVYAAGNTVTEPVVIERLLHQTMADTRTALDPGKVGALLQFFSHGINNALFRHQSLCWLAEAGVNLHLYGNGWENHPTLSKFARGPASHGEHLRRIYQASTINLQITPHGTLHQRLFEGLASGGFFLLRHVNGDELERHLRPIAKWCDLAGIETDEQLRARATPKIQQHVAAITQSLQLDPFAMSCPLVQTAQWSAHTGYSRSAGTVFGDDFDSVAFRNQAELLAKMKHFLVDSLARQDIAERMRAVVIRRFTYAATSKRLLAQIAGDFNGVRRLSPAA